MVSTKNLKVDTMEDIKRVARRPHSEALKAGVLAECSQPGVSVAKVAQAHGLNANLVHKWRRAAEAATMRASALGHTRDRADVGADTFIALALPPRRVEDIKPAALPDIRIEVRRGATTVNIHWPMQGGGDCAAWLREWLR